MRRVGCSQDRPTAPPSKSDVENGLPSGYLEKKPLLPTRPSLEVAPLVFPAGPRDQSGYQSPAGSLADLGTGVPHPRQPARQARWHRAGQCPRLPTGTR